MEFVREMLGMSGDTSACGDKEGQKTQDAKMNLIGLTLEEFDNKLISRGWRPEHVRKVWIAIYTQGR